MFAYQPQAPIHSKTKVNMVRFVPSTDSQAVPDLKLEACLFIGQLFNLMLMLFLT